MNNNTCKYELYIPDVGICCAAYSRSKRKDSLEWMHFPKCITEKCPLKHPELLEDASLEGNDGISE